MANKSKPKRNKPYRPRLVNVPVTDGLMEEFMFAGHGALAAMRLAPNKQAFDQLAGLLNVTYVGLCHAGIKSVVLESGMRALQEVAERNDEHGVLQVRALELLPIENAVFECEQQLRKMNVLDLYKASLKTRMLERLSLVAGQLEPA